MGHEGILHDICLFAAYIHLVHRDVAFLTQLAWLRPSRIPIPMSVEGLQLQNPALLSMKSSLTYAWAQLRLHSQRDPSVFKISTHRVRGFGFSDHHRVSGSGMLICLSGLSISECEGASSSLIGRQHH